MASSSSASNAPAWQTALDSRLTRRLMRPLKRPGVIGTHLARSAVSRLQRMAGGFPLLPKLSQRWSSPEVNAAGQVPIVYAQPALPSAETVAADSAASSTSSTHASPRPIVQAKAAPASPTSSSASISSVTSSLSSNNSATTTTSPVVSLSSGDQARPTLATRPTSSVVPSPQSSVVRPIQAEATHLQSGLPASDSKPVTPTSNLQAAALSPLPPLSSISSSLPVVRPHRAGGNVVQRKSIATAPTSAPSLISKQTDDRVQRKVEGEILQRLAVAAPSDSAASAESPAPMPVARVQSGPRPTSAPEGQPGRELFGEPTLNLASPAPVQRVVVRPLSSSSTESNRVQRAFHQPSVAASTPEVGRANAGGSAPASTLPFSAQANHAVPELIHTTSGNQAQPMPMISHTASTTPVIQRQAAPVEQKTPAPVIQRAPRRGGVGGSASDIDELAEKVQAKLAHWLTIESERRGLTRWD